MQITHIKALLHAHQLAADGAEVGVSASMLLPIRGHSCKM
jgi:hypothetical protein